MFSKNTPEVQKQSPNGRKFAPIWSPCFRGKKKFFSNGNRIKWNDLRADTPEISLISLSSW
jgi:hypothetical protein